MGSLSFAKGLIPMERDTLPPPTTRPCLPRLRLLGPGLPQGPPWTGCGTQGKSLAQRLSQTPCPCGCPEEDTVELASQGEVPAYLR